MLVHQGLGAWCCDARGNETAPRYPQGDPGQVGETLERREVCCSTMRQVQVQIKTVKEPRGWDSNLGGEVRGHSRGPHRVPQEIDSEITCKRLSGEGLRKREREKQAAQGASADSSGRQKARMAFQKPCHESRFRVLHGPHVSHGQPQRTKGHDLRQGYLMGQGQCLGRASSVSQQQATPHPGGRSWGMTTSGLKGS